MSSEDHVSMEGTLVMMDDVTPHVAVPVQVMQDGEVIATTLSDERGRYQFVDLKPGSYQLRCQVLGGCVYYGEEKARKTDEQMKPMRCTRLRGCRNWFNRRVQVCLHRRWWI
jgi:hypothetical protein